ncbi:BTAD domain-containing putative transcriptional regulator [Actinoplanes sp. NPDC089786]|uniref:BTAD domain-containing putative transcriptional regulator n=1 Tax=Actinoplanes sp. NPDC089786 TaxID=3155185 RepID=UPI00343E72AA
MDVTLLGAVRVARGDAVVPVPGARLQGLVVRLALAGGHPVEQAALVDAIWPDDPPAGAAHALQTLVSRLRRTLGAAGEVTQAAGGYRLDVTAADVDALRFERLAADGRDRLHAGDATTASVLLREALELWGDPAAIAAVAPAVATRLRHAAVEAVADLGEAELMLGKAAEAGVRLTALLAEHPADERAAALLMDALAAQGREAEALDRFEQTRLALADRLGADPGAALRERHLRLLRTGSDGPGSDGPRPDNLPAPLTALIGRDDDLARIDALFAAGRLVTVLGPGGAGKTRLAVEAARRRRHDHRDGVRMIDLAPVTEPAKVDAAVLAGIGLRSGRSRLGGLSGELDGRDALLLIDNCEHLIEAVAVLVAGLLARHPELRVLATSREPLAIGGEALVPLGPLALPAPDDGLDAARRTASVRLFAERAAAVRPGFDVDPSTLPRIINVVRALDGLPLALELAAARLRTMSLPELDAGLSDRFRLLTTGSRAAPPRHRTLRAVIAWSWDLLTDQERGLADRVAILPGGITTASAAAVSPGNGDLAGLVDRSILQLAPEPGRYRMLETLREYGLERLTAQGALGEARDRAARHCAELMSTHDPQLRGPEQAAAVRVITAEYDNVLAALRRRCDTGDAAGAIGLALSLTWYWHMFGRRADAAFWLGEALAVPGGEPGRERDCAEAIRRLNQGDAGPRPADLADRLRGYPDLPGSTGALTAVALAFPLNDPAAARTILDRLAGDDERLAGPARLFRAELAENSGELDTVRDDVEAALSCFRRAGDRWGRATALPLRAQLRQYDGDLDGALADLGEARSLAAEFGSLSLGDEVFVDLRWVDLHLRRGDNDRALAMIGVARERALRARSREMRALVDAWEAGFRARFGEVDRARDLLDRADRALRGATAFPGDHARALVGGVRASVLVELGDRPGAETALATAYAAARATGDRPVLSLAAVASAALAGAHGRTEEAAVLLGVAARLRGAHDHSDPQVRELMRRGRAALGDDGFDRAYRRGTSFEIDPAQAAKWGSLAIATNAASDSGSVSTRHFS